MAAAKTWTAWNTYVFGLRVRTRVSRCVQCAPKTGHQLRIDFGLLNNSLRFDHTRTHAHTKPIKACVRAPNAGDRTHSHAQFCPLVASAFTSYYSDEPAGRPCICKTVFFRFLCGGGRAAVPVLELQRMNGMNGWNYWTPSIPTRLTDRKLQVYRRSDWPTRGMRGW